MVSASLSTSAMCTVILWQESEGLSPLVPTFVARLCISTQIRNELQRSCFLLLASSDPPEPL